MVRVEVLLRSTPDLRIASQMSRKKTHRILPLLVPLIAFLPLAFLALSFGRLALALAFVCIPVVVLVVIMLLDLL